MTKWNGSTVYRLDKTSIGGLELGCGFSILFLSAGYFRKRKYALKKKLSGEANYESHVKNFKAFITGGV